jgi:hypothetical protein
MNYQSPLKDFREGVCADETAGTGVLIDDAPGAGPYIVGNAKAERVPKPEPVAFANGWIAIALKNDRVDVSLASGVRDPFHQLPAT